DDLDPNPDPNSRHWRTRRLCRTYRRTGGRRARRPPLGHPRRLDDDPAQPRPLGAPTRPGPDRPPLPGDDRPPLRLPLRRRHDAARRRRLPRLSRPRHVRHGHALRAGDHLRRRQHRRRPWRHRPLPVAADGAERGRDRPRRRRHALRRRRAGGDGRRRLGDRLALGAGDWPGARRVRAAAAAAVRPTLGRHLPGARRREPGDAGRDPDPGLAARVPLERLRGAGDDARLARHRRRLEPAVVDGGRRPRPVRQPRRGRGVVDRPARGADGGRLAAADRGGLLPALGPALPAARPL
ncbi:MAG: Efflux ABC transporter, permease protein, partial [uncultured Thermomicrobiales bacterium]